MNPQSRPQPVLGPRTGPILDDHLPTDQLPHLGPPSRPQRISTGPQPVPTGATAVGGRHRNPDADKRSLLEAFAVVGWPLVGLCAVLGVTLTSITLAINGDVVGAGALMFLALICGMIVGVAVVIGNAIGRRHR